MHFHKSAGWFAGQFAGQPVEFSPHPQVARNILARPSPPRSDPSPHPPRTRTDLLRATRGARGLRGPAGWGGLPAPRRALLHMMSP